MSDGIKRIDIREFREVGFLQEVNRQVLHPCGLALEVIVSDDGTEQLGGVWDYRDDPEGIVFAPAPDESKRVRVAIERLRHATERTRIFGWEEVQPCGE